jgi:hypothetical protein
MQIVMVPGLCSNEYQRTGGSFCESCFGRFLTHNGSPDLPCFTDVQDDGADETTLTMRHGGYEKAIQLTDEEREWLAYGGWKGWKEFVENLPPA